TPAHAWVLRPSGSIAVSAPNTMPAPPMAKRPKLTSCQSPGAPFSDAYWHIGDATIRLRIFRSRSISGVNSKGLSVGAAEAAPAATSVEDGDVSRFVISPPEIG